MPGWGRRAIGKGDRKLEEDVLFREIGGQLDASNFDYDQWQRTTKSKDSPAQHRLPSAPQKPRMIHDDTGTVASGFSSLVSKAGHRGHSAGSSCHGRKKEVFTPTNALANVEQKRQAESIKILQLRIRARKQTIDEYRLRQMELLEANMKLRENIEAQEATSHADVKKLLRKYERFRGGISTLNSQFLKDLHNAKEDLSETKKIFAEQLKRKEKDVIDVDNSLQENQNELQTLLNFKDKEYPVKALQITELQKEIELLKLQNKREEDELVNVVESEIGKTKKRQSETRSTMTGAAVQKAVNMMHPGLKEMATNNLVMQKEIEFHKVQIQELETENTSLELEVKDLLRDPKTNIRMMMFPEFFPKQPKCTPDMDIILDIPTQEWLPI